MKWIIYQDLDSDVANLNYYNSIKIAYLLNLKLVTVGIGETAYFIEDCLEQIPLKDKVDHLLAKSAKNPKEYQIYADIKQFLKDFTKL